MTEAPLMATIRRVCRKQLQGVVQRPVHLQGFDHACDILECRGLVEDVRGIGEDDRHARPHPSCECASANSMAGEPSAITRCGRAPLILLGEHRVQGRIVAGGRTVTVEMLDHQLGLDGLVGA